MVVLELSPWFLCLYFAYNHLAIKYFNLLYPGTEINPDDIVAEGFWGNIVGLREERTIKSASKRCYERDSSL